METIETLKAEIKKLSSQAVQAKMDLHDLSEELPANWERIPEGEHLNTVLGGGRRAATVFACASRHQRRRLHFGSRRPTPTRCAGRRSSRSARTATTRDIHSFGFHTASTAFTPLQRPNGEELGKLQNVAAFVG